MLQFRCWQLLLPPPRLLLPHAAGAHLERVRHEGQASSHQQQCHEGVGELQEELDDLGPLLGGSEAVEAVLLLLVLGLQAGGSSSEGPSAHMGHTGRAVHVQSQPAHPYKPRYLGCCEPLAALDIAEVNLDSIALCNLLGRQQMLIDVVGTPGRC